MNTRLHLLSVEFPAELLRKSLMLMAALMISVAAISQNTVVDVIVNSDDHNTLETAVLAAELDDDLSGDGPFTVFAPTDAAFEALPDGVLAGLLDDPTGALAKVLLYHVVGASVTSGDLTSGQFATTLNGDSIVVTIDGSDVYINNAMVTSADIAADNGIVHVIDAVITPGSTVYEVVAGSEDHTTLEAAVVAAGLQGTLSGPGPFTVFAPTDAAFENLPEGMVADLLADPKGELTEILLYHVVAAKALSGDLSDGQMITTVNGDSITVTISEGNVYIDSAMVTMADIETDNGVVHVIDAVLVPRTTVVDIIVSSPDHTTLEAAVIAAELADDLAGEGPFTVFAPTDAAFEALPDGVLAGLLDDPAGALTDVLLYHVLGDSVASGSLTTGQFATTLNGDSIVVTIDGSDVYINNAMVSVADIR
ncbi:MAG: fasciclin domain-containing protein, partial [Bacteroidales bacterium]